MKSHLSSWKSIIGPALLLLSTALVANAQTASSTYPSTDAEKIADALSAGPPFITKDATLLDWPTTSGGEYRVLRRGTSMLLAERGYGADWTRALCCEEGRAGIPPRCNRSERVCLLLALIYIALATWSGGSSTRQQCRRAATRYDNLAANYLAFIQLASIRLWLRVNESRPNPRVSQLSPSQGGQQQMETFLRRGLGPTESSLLHDRKPMSG
jgi:transposase